MTKSSWPPSLIYSKLNNPGFAGRLFFLDRKPGLQSLLRCAIGAAGDTAGRLAHTARSWSSLSLSLRADPLVADLFKECRSESHVQIPNTHILTCCRHPMYDGH